MRALTVMQPWAWAIAAGHKPVENRHWPLPPRLLGERIAIHAGKTYDDEACFPFGFLVPTRAAVALGAVIGVATLAGSCAATKRSSRGRGDEPYPMTRSPWFTGPWGHVFEGAILLPEPVPCRGMLGYWTLPEEVEDAVRVQLLGLSYANVELPADQAAGGER